MEKLGSYISAFIKGKTPKILYTEAADGLLPYVSPDYLRGKGTPEYYALLTSKTIPLEEDEIVILWDGSNAGEVLLSKRGILASTMVKLLVDETRLDKKYFAYSCLNLEYILKAKTAGSGIPHADKGVIKNLPFYFPKEKSEQESIAKILSTVDEAIRCTNETIQKLERVKKSLMQKLLSGKMKANGTMRTADEFYKDEKMGLVPKGWKCVKMKDVGFVQTGKTPPTAESNVFADTLSEGYMFITPGDLGESKYIADSERYVTDKGISFSYRLPKGSIVIVCIGSTIGKIGIISNESCTNQQINALIVNGQNNNEFLYYMMQYRTPHFKEIAGINATPQINKSTFQKYKIVIPTDALEQVSIANKLSTLDLKIYNKYNKITKLELLKKSLMQQLLTGKVRVDVEKVMEVVKG